MIKVGYQDASIQMDVQSMKDGIMDLAKTNGNANIKKGVENHQIEKLEESLHQIQISMNNENTYNMIKKVKNFINKVEDIVEVDEGGLLIGEEKAILIDAAKQLHVIITDKITTKSRLD